MTYHNTGDEGYKGLEPLDESYLGSSFRHEFFPPEERDGLFYRTDLKVDYDALVEKLLSTPGEATIEDYQYWTELGWKAEHGTYPAVQRFGNKLSEEIRELIEAAEHAEEDPEHVVTEAGDVLWCATALACVAMAKIDSGLKTSLYGYVMGVQNFNGRQQHQPEWRPTAATLATKYEPLTVADIAELIQAGFEPLFIKAINIYSPSGDQDEITDHLSRLNYLGHRLISGSRQQFGRDEDDQTVETLVLDSAFAEQSEAAGELVASIYLEVAFILDRTSGQPISSAIRDNVAKISDRIATNTVDKTDGDRS